VRILGKRYRFTLVHGRHSTPVEVLLRMLICKHLSAWSFKETEARVKDSLVLRWFCRVYFQTVPDSTTLFRWLETIRPETLHARECPGGAISQASKSDQRAQIAPGREPSVQTNIHHPTDSGLLVESVRVLSRFVKGAKAFVKDHLTNVGETCRSRLRSARTTAQILHRQLRRKGEEKEAEQKALYRSSLRRPSRWCGRPSA
jgi:transposase, IS5 family